MDELLTKPIWQMTGQEFLSLLKNNEEERHVSNEPIKLQLPESKYVYGIRGIANLLSCSIAKANRVKKTGILDDAIIQHGRTIMVDVEKALDLLKEADNKKA